MTRTGCLTVATDRRGSVRFLVVSGDLSTVSVARFADAVQQHATAEEAARVVIDLSGVRAVDAAGARALAAAVSPAPGRCRVVLRALRPSLQQVVMAVSTDLDLAGSGLAMTHEDRPADIEPGSATWVLEQESRRTRSLAEQMITSSRRAAQLLAETKDGLAETLASLGSRRPSGHDGVVARSRLARIHAARLRNLTAAADRHESSRGTVPRAIAFIDEHARDDISAADIAAAACVTPRAVQLAFRRHLGITPMGYLRQVRLEQAHRELLSARADDRTVTRIAADWGFTNLSRFSAQYRETYGVPPSHTLRHAAGVQSA